MSDPHATETMTQDMIDRVCAGMGSQTERDAVWSYITKLKDTIDTWGKKYGPSCPEDVYQSDRCSVNATGLVEDIFDVVGYCNHD